MKREEEQTEFQKAFTEEAGPLEQAVQASADAAASQPAAAQPEDKGEGDQLTDAERKAKADKK